MTGAIIVIIQASLLHNLISLFCAVHLKCPVGGDIPIAKLTDLSTVINFPLEFCPINYLLFLEMFFFFSFFLLIILNIEIFF